MLSREFLRENAVRLLGEMPERFAGSGIDRFVELDRLRRDTVTRLEEKRRRRNTLTSVRGKPSPEGLAEMKTLKEEIRALEEEDERHSLELSALETRIPNVPHDSVPRGKDETANRLRGRGESRGRFPPPQAHWDLGPALGILDFERGVSSRARASPSSWERARGSHGRSRPSCSTCTRASTATRRSSLPS
jgi:seryl-tRNA synthetase